MFFKQQPAYEIPLSLVSSKRCIRDRYDQKLQLAPSDRNPKLDKKRTLIVQSCVGSLLYYARAVDATMLPAINEISGTQASPTVKTQNACKMLMDYAANTYPLAIIRYHASDMISSPLLLLSRGVPADT